MGKLIRVAPVESYFFPVRSNYVCFGCRTVRKGSGHCPSCRKPMQCIGKHWRIGKKTDDKEWRKIEKILQASRSQSIEATIRSTGNKIQKRRNTSPKLYLK